MRSAIIVYGVLNSIMPAIGFVVCPNRWEILIEVLFVTIPLRKSRLFVLSITFRE